MATTKNVLTGFSLGASAMALFAPDVGADRTALFAAFQDARPGRGSVRHDRGGDTVGDPVKNTAGPPLNIVTNPMSAVALVMAPLLR